MIALSSMMSIVFTMTAARMFSWIGELVVDMTYTVMELDIVKAGYSNIHTVMSNRLLLSDTRKAALVVCATPKLDADSHVPDVPDVDYKSGGMRDRDDEIQTTGPLIANFPGMTPFGAF